MAPLVPDPEVFPDTRPGAWVVRIRRLWVESGSANTLLLLRDLDKVADELGKPAPEYVERVHEAVEDPARGLLSLAAGASP